MWIVDLVSQPFDWRIYRKQFKGQSLEEELAYSNYYHFSNSNRVLHFFSYFCIFSLLTAQFHDTFGLLGHGCWYAFFFLVYSKISFHITIIYVFLMHLGYPFLQNTIPLYYTPIMVLVFQLLQLAGHVVFERKFPAFRLFEAVVTTPIAVALTSLNELIPIQRELFKDVARCTTIWKQKIEAQQ